MLFKSELAKLIEKLEGYDENDWYEVSEAKKTGDYWVVTVRHRVEKSKKNAGAENENNK